jgi:hypothetical protein
MEKKMKSQIMLNIREVLKASKMGLEAVDQKIAFYIIEVNKRLTNKKKKYIVV